VKTESDGLKGFEKAQQENLDLIILDLMLPGMKGEDICYELRMKGISTPILVLTASRDEIDEITLLKFGANDFISKPVSMRRLLARVENQMRIQTLSEKELDVYQFGNVHLDFKKHEAYKNDKPLTLTSTHYNILKMLIQHEGEVVSRTDLLMKVWKYNVDNLPTTRTVDNYILKLRQEIEDDPAHPQHILTYYKAGYKFVQESEM
jgi:DNA-binding response OmpR family regulator